MSGYRCGICKKSVKFDVKNIGIKKLFTLFDHTPIFEEALDKLIWERMDIHNTEKDRERE